jgi:hypothetical protein
MSTSTTRLLRALFRASLLAWFVLLLGGCTFPTQFPTLPPGITHDALAFGAGLALLLRRMVTDGTWPQGTTWKEPWKTIIPGLIGALAAVLTSVAHGSSWNDAANAAIAGLPTLIQGAFEAMLKQKPQGGQGSQGSQGAQGGSQGAQGGGQADAQGSPPPGNSSAS